MPDPAELPPPPSEPKPWERDISDEDAREFQRLMKEECGVKLDLEAARHRAREMVDLMHLLLDPQGWEQRRKDFLAGYDLPRLQPGTRVTLPEPDPPKPDPRPFPIPLDGDHGAAVLKGLALAGDELRWVRHRPSNWRYPVVGMYEALGHALALVLGRRAPGPEDGLHHLTHLCSASVEARILPKSGPVVEAVERLEQLRTAYLSLGVSSWPTGPRALPKVFEECLSVVLALSDRMDEAHRVSVVERSWKILRRVRALPPSSRRLL